MWRSFKESRCTVGGPQGSNRLSGNNKSWDVWTTGCLTDQQVWFPGDIFKKTQQTLQFYRHLPGRVTNPCDHTDPVYPSNSSVKEHLPGLIAPISITPGLLQYVFTCTLWSTRILSQPENFQESLLISSRFPGLPGGKNNSSRFPGFPGMLDTLWKWQVTSQHMQPSTR